MPRVLLLATLLPSCLVRLLLCFRLPQAPGKVGHLGLVARRVQVVLELVRLLLRVWDVVHWFVRKFACGQILLWWYQILYMRAGSLVVPSQTQAKCIPHSPRSARSRVSLACMALSVRRYAPATMAATVMPCALGLAIRYAEYNEAKHLPRLTPHGRAKSTGSSGGSQTGAMRTRRGDRWSSRR